MGRISKKAVFIILVVANNVKNMCFLTFGTWSLELGSKKNKNRKQIGKNFFPKS